MTLTGNVSQRVMGTDRPGGEPANDISLDAPPPTTRREMLKKAREEVSDVIGREEAPKFHADPIRYACKMRSDEWARVYALIEARQPKELRA